MQIIDQAVLDQAVTGINLKPGTLRDQLHAERPMLFVFLRHFGCIFCRETIGEISQASGTDSTYPDVLFFYQGSAEYGRSFFETVWPEARAVADLPRFFYDAFDVRRGTMRQMMGPDVIACGIRASRKGYGLGMPTSDPLVMPGLFLVQGERVIWTHDFKHAGDHPDFAAIPGLAGVKVTV